MEHTKEEEMKKIFDWINKQPEMLAIINDIGPDYCRKAVDMHDPLVKALQVLTEEHNSLIEGYNIMLRQQNPNGDGDFMDYQTSAEAAEILEQAKKLQHCSITNK